MDMDSDVGLSAVPVDLEMPDYLGATALTVEQLRRCLRRPAPHGRRDLAGTRPTTVSARPLSSTVPMAGERY